ncbi:hypothetical protein ABBQ38_005640 [Trebouxia sp. C0009 RCD-2024]
MYPFSVPCILLTCSGVCMALGCFWFYLEAPDMIAERHRLFFSFTFLVGSGQQDCEELVGRLLDCLSQDLNTVKHPAYRQHHRPLSSKLSVNHHPTLTARAFDPRQLFTCIHSPTSQAFQDGKVLEGRNAYKCPYCGERWKPARSSSCMHCQRCWWYTSKGSNIHSKQEYV